MKAVQGFKLSYKLQRLIQFVSSIQFCFIPLLYTVVICRARGKAEVHALEDN